jgi:hypothetical protein
MINIKGKQKATKSKLTKFFFLFNEHKGKGGKNIKGT